MLDEPGGPVGGHNTWLPTLVGPAATASVIDPTRSGAVAERILGANYAGVMSHDGGSPDDAVAPASHQQCLGHRLRRGHDWLATATRGAVRCPRRIRGRLPAALDRRDRQAAGRVSDHGRTVARGRLANGRADAVAPLKSNAANRLYQN